MLQLTQKEQQLLQDQKAHEELCIQKYQTGAQQAADPQLKQLFQTYAQEEAEHLNTINSILGGQVPIMNQGQQVQQSQPAPANAQNLAPAEPSPASPASKQTDSMLCSDMLMSEKYVSGAYDTTIFECTDSNIRQALNHIQKEEQQHGEGISNYMNSQGMYNVK